MQLENCSPEFQRIFERYTNSIRYSKPESLAKSIDRLLQERNKKALLIKDEYDLFYREAMQEFQSKVDGSFNPKAIQMLTGQKNSGYNKKQIVNKKHLLKLFENPEDYLETEEDDIIEKFNRQLTINKTIKSNQPKYKQENPKIFSNNSTLNKSSKKLGKIKELIEDVPKLKKSIEKAFKEENKYKSMINNCNKKIRFKEPIEDFKDEDTILTHENVEKLEKILTNLASNKDTSKILKLIDKHKKLETNMQKIQKYESQILKSNQISLRFIEHNEIIKKRLQNKYKRVMEKHFS